MIPYSRVLQLGESKYLLSCLTVDLYCDAPSVRFMSLPLISISILGLVLVLRTISVSSRLWRRAKSTASLPSPVWY